jgi:hypothetical protein
MEPGFQEVRQMAVVRWEPSRELATMEIDRLHRMFDNLFMKPRLGSSS